jgi:hypothetical protein
MAKRRESLLQDRQTCKQHTIRSESSPGCVAVIKTAAKDSAGESNGTRIFLRIRRSNRRNYGSTCENSSGDEEPNTKHHTSSQSVYF